MTDDNQDTNGTIGTEYVLSEENPDLREKMQFAAKVSELTGGGIVLSNFRRIPQHKIQQGGPSYIGTTLDGLDMYLLTEPTPLGIRAGKDPLYVLMP